MPRIDYDNYLENQDEWAHSLEKLAQESAPREARDLSQIVAVMRRRLAELKSSSDTEE